MISARMGAIIHYVTHDIHQLVTRQSSPSTFIPERNGCEALLGAKLGNG